MEFHELANDYPLMPAYELGRMEEDMRERGFDERFPIVTYDGKILDGRNRYLASENAEVEPLYVEFVGTDDEARMFVQRANEERRHLAKDWLDRRRAERIERVAAARREGQSLRTIAAGEGVAVAQVQRDLEVASATVPGGGTVAPEAGKVTGKDGRTYTATPAKSSQVFCAHCTTLTRKGLPAERGCADCKAARAPAREPGDDYDAIDGERQANKEARARNGKPVFDDRQFDEAARLAAKGLGQIERLLKDRRQAYSGQSHAEPHRACVNAWAACHQSWDTLLKAIKAWQKLSR